MTTPRKTNRPTRVAGVRRSRLRIEPRLSEMEDGGKHAEEIEDLMFLGTELALVGRALGTARHRLIPLRPIVLSTTTRKWLDDMPRDPAMEPMAICDAVASLRRAAEFATPDAAQSLRVIAAALVEAATEGEKMWIR